MTFTSVRERRKKMLISDFYMTSDHHRQSKTKEQQVTEKYLGIFNVLGPFGGSCMKQKSFQVIEWRIN